MNNYHHNRLLKLYPESPLDCRSRPWPWESRSRQIDGVLELLDDLADGQGRVSISRVDLAMLIGLPLRSLGSVLRASVANGDLRHLNSRERIEARFPGKPAGRRGNGDLALQLVYYEVPLGSSPRRKARGN